MTNSTAIESDLRETLNVVVRRVEGGAFPPRIYDAAYRQRHHIQIIGNPLWVGVMESWLARPESGRPRAGTLSSSVPSRRTHSPHGRRWAPVPSLPLRSPRRHRGGDSELFPHVSASLRLCGRPSPNGFTEQTMPSALLAQRFGVHGAGFHAGARRRGASGVLTVFGGCHQVLAGGPLGCGLEPWFVPQPGALPRAGVCRAVGAHEPCKAFHVWVHRVDPLLDSSGPTPALDPTDAVEEPAFPMSPRLCVSAGDLPPMDSQSSRCRRRYWRNDSGCMG